MRDKRKKLTNLLDNVVEKAVKKLGLKLLFKPPVKINVNDIGFFSGTCAASEKPNNTTILIKDN